MGLLGPDSSPSTAQTHSAPGLLKRGIFRSPIISLIAAVLGLRGVAGLSANIGYLFAVSLRYNRQAWSARFCPS